MQESFNPILVWFYQNGIWRRGVQAKSFQSHFGLILSLTKIRKQRPTYPFNPILVWFYRTICGFLGSCTIQLSIPFWSDFIDKDLWILEDSLRAFNPILVWFYLAHPFLPPVVKTDTLSIPFWSDFIFKHGGICEKTGILSIPFWSDFILQLHI